MPRALTIALVIFAMTPCAPAQEVTDPAQAYNLAVRAIGSENWDEGLRVVGGIIKIHGNSGLNDYGPVFGHFYYLRGLLQIGKKDWAGALESFRICYEKYENTEANLKTPDNSTEVRRLNTFRNQALVQWGNVLMQQEDFAGAAERFERALVEGADDSGVNRTYVGVNLGRCYIKAGEIDKGYDFIVRPLSSNRFSAGLKNVIFMILSEDWSPQVPLPPLREFLNEFRSIVTSSSLEERYGRNPRFDYLAQLAIQQDDPIRALAWYSLMIDPRILIPFIENRITALEERKVTESQETLKADTLAKMAVERDTLTDDYWRILNGIGSAHFQLRNFSASFIAFSRLSDGAAKDPKTRPVYLHNAVASAAQIDNWRKAYLYGTQFLDEFPTHELLPGVARVLVEVVFLRGEYQEAYDIAGDVRVGMPVRSMEREIPDFVYGASAFHLDLLEEADRELGDYLKNYPTGRRVEPAEFYAGMTKVRLQQWEAAASILNGFILKYPASDMVPGALYQCALAEFMLDQTGAALAKIDRVLNEFPDADVVASCWNLKGDIFAGDGDKSFEEIESCYLTAISVADPTGQLEVAAYSRWQLVIQNGDVEAWQKAEILYDEFQARHADSIYRLDLLTAGLPTLVTVGRTEEALERLRAATSEFASVPESQSLSEMFGTYMEFIGEQLGPEGAIAELNARLADPNDGPALNGWLRIGLVEIYSSQDDEASRKKAKENLFLLQADFDPALQSNYVIVQLARWLARERNKDEEAKKLYDFVIEKRPGTANYDYALTDVAEIQARSQDPALRSMALESFQRVFAEVQNEELRELAVLGTARLLTAEDKFAEAQPHWEQYLENRSWTVARPEANYELAQCYHAQGNKNDALKIYVSVYANFPGHLDWSTRAYLSTALILKEGGHDLKALMVLKDMLQRMGHHDHPGVVEAKKLFIKWRDAYTPAETKTAGS